MKKNRVLMKITAFMMAAVLVFAQNCFVFAAEETAPGEEAVSEDAVTEEPAAEESVVEEPVAEEPAAEESVGGESTAEEPAVPDEPAAAEEPVAEEPSVSAGSAPEETFVQDAASEEITAAEPEADTATSARIFEGGGDSIPVGAKINLKSYFGMDSEYKNVKFSITSGKSCAELNGSTLVAKKAGDVGVKVTYKYDGEKGEDETGFTIYSVGFKKKKVIWNDKSEYDATQNLKGDTVEGSPTWSSSAETVAKIDSSTGKVTVLAGGSTVISAAYSYGEDKTKICKFKLIVKLPGLKISSKQVKFGGVFITPLVNIEKGTEVTWSLDSGETRAVFVDQEKGKIKLVGVATESSPVLLHAKAGTEELTASITTTEPAIGGLPKSYEEYGSVRLKKGKTKQFSVKNIAKGYPATWSSSDEETVSVSSKGVVKAKQYGSATITADIEGYGTLSVEIEVPDPNEE